MCFGIETAYTAIYEGDRTSLCLVTCLGTAIQILGLPSVSQFSYTCAASSVNTGQSLGSYLYSLVLPVLFINLLPVLLCSPTDSPVT